MATGARRTGDGGNGGKKATLWIIIGVVVLITVLLFFWLFDVSGDVEGGDINVTPPEVDAELETPDVDVDGGELPDVDVDVDGGEAPDVDVSPAD